MINAIEKFMGLVPLLLPELINDRQPEDTDIIDNSAILEFRLDEPLPMGYVMDMISNNTEMKLLYNVKEQQRSARHSCCFFYSPNDTKCLFKINAVTNERWEVSSIMVTVYDDIVLMGAELQEDLNLHTTENYNLIAGMPEDVLLQIFATL